MTPLKTPETELKNLDDTIALVKDVKAQAEQKLAELRELEDDLVANNILTPEELQRLRQNAGGPIPTIKPYMVGRQSKHEGSKAIRDEASIKKAKKAEKAARKKAHHR